MRHRRRLTTQTIQRKNSTGTFQAIHTPKKSKAGKYFLILLIVVSIVTAGIIYKDEISNLFPLDNISFLSAEDDSTDTVAESEPLPAEDEVKDEQILFEDINNP